MKKIIKIVLFLMFCVSFIFLSIYFAKDYIKVSYDYINPFLGEEQVNFEKKYVIPGGQTVGVELKTKGILVVGLADVVTDNKISVSPARKSGIKIGDKIISIDNVPVDSTRQFVDYVNLNGIKEYNLKIERNTDSIQLLMKPVERYNSSEIIFGFWARDNVAGIGTVTYIDPETNYFSAVAHGITDSDTKDLIDIDNGSISKANITNIKSGKKNEPGEIIGFILKDDGKLGSVSENTEFGIKGIIDKGAINFFSDRLIELGNKDMVKEGPAYLLACLGENVKEYKVDIIRVYNQNEPDNKSFVVKIVDKELLSLTNGIIQGMSGCPIIQDEKLVGAITHVFMKDPTKGYGIYIDWLLDSDNRNKSNM